MTGYANKLEDYPVFNEWGKNSVGNCYCLDEAPNRSFKLVEATGYANKLEDYPVFDEGDKKSVGYCYCLDGAPNRLPVEAVDPTVLPNKPEDDSVID